MKITLLHPSRGRAEKAKETLDFWLSKTSKTIEIEHILSLDNDDPEVPLYRGLFKENVEDGLTKIVVSNNDCVVKATNIAATISTGDILIYFSDDFKCPDIWDLNIIDFFDGLMNGPALIKVDDCLQKFEVAVLTIPIMNRLLMERLGYFWHPEYRSMFVDEHLYWVCKNNNWLHFTPELKFPHEHVCNGKAENDETYKRSSANWDQGKALFAKHKLEGFLV